MQINLEMISIAETQLKKKCKATREQMELCEQLKNEQPGRLLCPFCQYTSEKNKMSANIKGKMFKCFACGLARRVA
jgi:hypothetical protein